MRCDLCLAVGLPRLAADGPSAALSHNRAASSGRIQGGSVSQAQVIGWENIELISDRPLGIMLDEFRRLKLEFPDRQALGPGWHRIPSETPRAPCYSMCSR